jgi:hypothetical protein
MPTYEKLTLDRFKLSLKEGKYETPTGARRAIGKTTSWTAKDREAAQELVNKHFGGAASATKTAAKTGSKKAAAKKTTAKAASASPKKTAAKKTGARKARSSSDTNGVGEVHSITRTPQPESPEDHRIVAQEMLAFASNARRELEASELVVGAQQTQVSRQQLVGIVNNAIAHMNQAAANLPKPGGVTTKIGDGFTRIEVPKQAEASSPTPTPTEEKVETVADVQKQEAKAPAVGDDNLTENERAAKEMFLQNNPGILSGLPTPT